MGTQSVTQLEREGVVTLAADREDSFTLGARQQKRPPNLSWTGDSGTAYTS